MLIITMASEIMCEEKLSLVVDIKPVVDVTASGVMRMRTGTGSALSMRNTALFMCVRVVLCTRMVHGSNPHDAHIHWMIPGDGLPLCCLCDNITAAYCNNDRVIIWN